MEWSSLMVVLTISTKVINIKTDRDNVNIDALRKVMKGEGWDINTSAANKSVFICQLLNMSGYDEDGIERMNKMINIMSGNWLEGDLSRW